MLVQLCMLRRFCWMSQPSRLDELAWRLYILILSAKPEQNAKQRPPEKKKEKRRCAGPWGVGRQWVSSMEGRGHKGRRRPGAAGQRPVPNARSSGAGLPLLSVRIRLFMVP